MNLFFFWISFKIKINKKSMSWFKNQTKTFSNSATKSNEKEAIQSDDHELLDQDEMSWRNFPPNFMAIWSWKCSRGHKLTTTNSTPEVRMDSIPTNAMFGFNQNWGFFYFGGNFVVHCLFRCKSILMLIQIMNWTVSFFLKALRQIFFKVFFSPPVKKFKSNHFPA